MLEDTRSRTPAILIRGAAALLLIIGVMYVATRLRPASPAAAAAPLPMGAAEQAYAQQIQFVDPSVAAPPTF